MPASPPQLVYDAGTLLIEGAVPPLLPPQFVWDARVEKYRAPAVLRRGSLGFFAKRHINIEDCCSQAKALDLHLSLALTSRPYQQAAITAWTDCGRCGTVVLPTGAGKTFVALTAIADVGRSTLVVAPTIDLMNQWYSLLVDAFTCEIGILGGGYHELRDITVTTYDSAYRYAADYGNRFDLLICDEVHHLPAPSYRQIPLLSTAWFRLGLTATYERLDYTHNDLEFLLGPVVYKCGIDKLKGEYLADYEIIRIRTTLTDEELARYRQCENRYQAFLQGSGIKPFGTGWVDFLKASGYRPEARDALLAKFEMQRIVINSERKLEVLDSLLKQHWQDKIIIFTEHNELVYRISSEFLLPAITHQTKARERKWILDSFKGELLHAIVTSKVLNEGIDVPSAKIAIVLSGSASPREYLQRLGRILRKGDGQKRAILYEVVTSATREMEVSARRRKTDAYT